MKIEGSTILLTGATGGIGQAVARSLAGRGGTLLLTGRRADVLEPLAAELGGRAIACDLADRDAVARLAHEAGDVDVLVANAALPGSGAVLDRDLDRIDRALEVNLRAPIALARLLVDGMVARRRGHMVFMSSLSGKAASPGSAIYSATKFGMRGFAQGLREDLRPHGVGVSTIFPGFIRDAGMFADSGAKLPAGVGTRTPEQVAAAVLRAIERDRAELDVAPLSLRVGTGFAQLAPSVAAAVQRRLGANRISADMAAGQDGKR